jgi:hypothetical protein
MKSSIDLVDISPEEIAALKKQLRAANKRLLMLERERQKLKDDIAALAALLKRDEPRRSR